MGVWSGVQSGMDDSVELYGYQCSHCGTNDDANNHSCLSRCRSALQSQQKHQGQPHFPDLIDLTVHQKSERYIKALASQQRKMDAYIKEHMDSTHSGRNQISTHRFASANGPFQTAFQRHILSLVHPADYSVKHRTSFETTLTKNERSSSQKEPSLTKKDDAY